MEPSLDTAAGTWADQDPVRAQKSHENGMHSLMVEPIRARPVLLGVALSIRTVDPTPFQEVDLLLAEALVSREARSLDNVRQNARGHTTALTFQRHLLPYHLKGRMAGQVASRYRPPTWTTASAASWFDVILLPGAQVALVVSGVVGHGLHAADRERHSRWADDRVRPRCVPAPGC
ncbi:hypothetical protein ACIOTI_42370 [Streptomyces sp. NPDC087843]|uniref:hypothetical protein n=1 Tax=Streptomyces sp. NPDC087843 TaxID=3365804 RepID=UPI00382E4C00